MCFVFGQCVWQLCANSVDPNQTGFGAVFVFCVHVCCSLTFTVNSYGHVMSRRSVNLTSNHAIHGQA